MVYVQYLVSMCFDSAIIDSTIESFAIQAKCIIFYLFGSLKLCIVKMIDTVDTVLVFLLTFQGTVMGSSFPEMLKFDSYILQAHFSSNLASDT